MQAKKHHYVPECYLKKFLTQDTLFVLDIKKLAKGYNEFARKYSPAQICYIEDYYKIKDQFKDGQSGLDGYKELFIESELLHRLEDRYNDLYYRLTNSTRITIADAIDWSDFIIQMKARNPYFLEQTIAKNQNNWIDSSMQNIYEKISGTKIFPGISDEIKKLVIEAVGTMNKNDLDFSKKRQLATLVNRHSDNIMSRNDKYRNTIINCYWQLLIAEKEPYFITSDNPGFSLGKDNMIYNTKFSDGFSFYFPLSPQYSLLISDDNYDNSYSENHEYKTIHKTTVPADLVLFMNNMCTRKMNKLLIASNANYLSGILESHRKK